MWLMQEIIGPVYQGIKMTVLDQADTDNWV